MGANNSWANAITSAKRILEVEPCAFAPQDFSACVTTILANLDPRFQYTAVWDSKNASQALLFDKSWVAQLYDAPSDKNLIITRVPASTAVTITAETKKAVDACASSDEYYSELVAEVYYGANQCLAGAYIYQETAHWSSMSPAKFYHSCDK